MTSISQISMTVLSALTVVWMVQSVQGDDGGGSDVTQPTIASVGINSSPVTNTNASTSGTATTTTASSTVYTWVAYPETYIPEDKALEGHVYITWFGKQTLQQCAIECLKHTRCQSFNYQQTTGQCDLNSASHVDRPDDLHDKQTWEYHLKTSFSIDKS